MGWIQLLLDRFKKKPIFIPPQRKVDRVFIHCSASDEPAHDNVKTIREWHKKRNFSDIGYHFIITKDGVIHKGRDIEKKPAAQYPHNTGTIAICLTGLELFTNKQFLSLKELCREIDETMAVTFHGHCEVSAKTCPVFPYKAILKLDKKGNLGI